MSNRYGELSDRQPMSDLWSGNAFIPFTRDGMNLNALGAVNYFRNFGQFDRESLMLVSSTMSISSQVSLELTRLRAVLHQGRSIVREPA